MFRVHDHVYVSPQIINGVPSVLYSARRSESCNGTGAYYLPHRTLVTQFIIIMMMQVAERNLRRSMREVEVKLGEEVKRSDELKAQLQAAIAEGKRERDARHAAVAGLIPYVECF